MTLYEHLMQYNLKTTGELDAYCKLEGLNPVDIFTENRQEPKKAKNSVGRLFSKWFGRLGLSGS